MWQIMWMFSLLPDWVWITILVAGVVGMFAGTILKFIPFVNQYRYPIQLAGIAAVILSVWVLGGSANEAKWQARVQELEEKLKVAEEKSSETNKQVEVQVVEKTKIIKEKGKDIIKYVDREVVKNQEIVKYIENCPVPKEIIDLHNQAVDINKAAEGKK
jgi:translation elongation factor EF-Tu-like GTPase